MRSPWTAMWALCACFFMIMLDSTIVTVAIPTMLTELDANLNEVVWVNSVYLLANTVPLLITGRLGDRFGPKNVLVAGLIAFTAASAWSGVATSAGELIAARVLQGLGAALMTPQTLSFITRLFPPEKRGVPISVWGAVAGVATLAGPVLGGLLVEHVGWQWIFLINLPIGVLGVILVLRYIPDYSGTPGQPLDVPGLLLSGVALGGLVFGFEVLGHGLLPRQWALLLIGGGLLSAWLYVLHARRTAYPLIDFSLLKIPTFAVSFWGGNLMRIGSASQPFLLVLLFQLCFGLNPLQAGLLSVAGGVGALLMKMLAVRIVSRFGFRRTLIGNAVLTGATILACSLFEVSTPYWIVILVLFGSGIIRSLQFSTLGALTYADVPPEQSSRASSLSAMTIQLTLSLSVGIAAGLLGLIMAVRGHATVEQSDIAWIMAGAGLLCALSGLVYRRLSPQAGSAIYAKRAEGIG